MEHNITKNTNSLCALRNSKYPCPIDPYYDARVQCEDRQSFIDGRTCFTMHGYLLTIRHYYLLGYIARATIDLAVTISESNFVFFGFLFMGFPKFFSLNMKCRIVQAKVKLFHPKRHL